MVGPSKGRPPMSHRKTDLGILCRSKICQSSASISLHSHPKAGMASMEKYRETPTYMYAKNMLPLELQPQLDELLQDYRFAALRHRGREWASPKVLAELVLMGWRSSVAPVEVNDPTKK